MFSGRLPQTATIEEFIHELATSRTVTGCYLARNLSREQIYESIRYHYLFLSQKVCGTKLHLIARESQLIWSRNIRDVAFSVKLYYETVYPQEGELTLDFFVGDVSIFVISFTIVPRSTLDFGYSEVVMVSRMQGRSGKLTQTRAATKAIGEISPQAFLFSVLKGIAQALSINAIVGACAQNLISFKEDLAQMFVRRYDQFFESIGASGPSRGFYFLDNTSLDGTPKPTSGKHRSRARLKRNLKWQIANSVKQQWLDWSSVPEADPESENIKLLKNSAGFKSVDRFFFTQDSLEYYMLRLGFFDIDYYNISNPDVVAAGVDPVRHYLKYGAKEMRNPSRNFNTKEYVLGHPDVVGANLNPLVHFILTTLQNEAETARAVTTKWESPTAPASVECMRDPPDVAAIQMPALGL